MLGSVLGRAVIAMIAVRIRMCDESGKVTDLSDVRPPTDVMAITSLPHTLAYHPGSGFPLSVLVPIRQTLTAIRPPYLLLGAATSVTKTAVLGEWPE